MEEEVNKDNFEEKNYGTFAYKMSGEDVGEAWPPIRVSYDDVLEQIGEFGRWQQWQIILYSIPPFVSGALFMLGSFTSKTSLPYVITQIYSHQTQISHMS